MPDFQKVLTVRSLTIKSLSVVSSLAGKNQGKSHSIFIQLMDYLY